MDDDETKGVWILVSPLDEGSISVCSQLGVAFPADERYIDKDWTESIESTPRMDTETRARSFDSEEEEEEEDEEEEEEDDEEQVEEDDEGWTFHLPAPAQALAFGSAPLYPNSVKWSNENLLAVASGHLVYILNPAALSGPRGFVSLTTNPAFNIGRIRNSDRQAASVQALALAKESRPYVRSLDWSPQGFSSNGGCLLAVCTTDHRVKLYRAPYREFQSEWIEVLDVSALIYAQYAQNHFAETQSTARALALEDEASAPQIRTVSSRKRKAADEARLRPGKRRINRQVMRNTVVFDDPEIRDGEKVCEKVCLLTSSQLPPISQGSRIEVRREKGGVRVWLSGIVLKVTGSRTLVRYGTSLSDAKEEWLDSNLCRENGVLRTAAPCMRPLLTAEMLLQKGLSVSLLYVERDGMSDGDPVEIWKNDRWQEGVLVDAACVPPKVSITGDRAVLDVEQVFLRRPPRWSGKDWEWSCNQEEAANKRILLRRGPEVEVTAAQYAARSNELAHLVSVWSALCSAACGQGGKGERRRHFVMLAIGGKSGKVFFFRVPKLLSFSGETALPLHEMDYLGSVPAHESWVTGLAWASTPGESEDVGTALLLASGGSNGSVKLWMADVQSLADCCPSPNGSPLELLKEVLPVDRVPVTSLAMIPCSHAAGQVVLAVGKASGSLVALECHRTGDLGSIACELRAHDHLVTGLTWTFDGRILYSCSQDSRMRTWEFSNSRLWPVAFPSGSSLLTTDTSQTTLELPASSLESFFGLALSPGNLALVVVRFAPAFFFWSVTMWVGLGLFVSGALCKEPCKELSYILLRLVQLRSIAADMVDQMYQARSQKGVVQLFWIGGQHIQGDFPPAQDCVSVGLPGEDLARWKSRIVAALHHIEEKEQPLVLWDIVAATSSIRVLTESTQHVGDILSSWICSKQESSTTPLEWSLEQMEEYLREASCRRLQMLNLTYRYLLLVRFRADVLSGRSSQVVWDTHRRMMSEQDKQLESSSPDCVVRQEELWRVHLAAIELELRQRLMYVSLFASVWKRIYLEENENTACFEDDWSPSGTHLMAAWVCTEGFKTFPELLQITARASDSGNECRLGPWGSGVRETCTICEAPVPLESPELGHCSREGEASKHKLQRCAVSLEICPAIPLWQCQGCARSVVNLPPFLFFSMTSRTQVDYIPLPLLLHETVCPCCPFCGILILRPQPKFLLAASLV